MADWYEKGYKQLINEIVVDTDVKQADVSKVYSWLNDVGLIDYDIEKEVIYERYFGD